MGYEADGGQRYHILTELESRVSNADPARIGHDILILAVHVDNCAMTGSSRELIIKYKLNFTSSMSSTRSRIWGLFTGIKISRNRVARAIALSQTAYLESIQFVYENDIKGSGRSLEGNRTRGGLGCGGGTIGKD